MHSVIRVPIILQGTEGVKIQSSGDEDKGDHQNNYWFAVTTLRGQADLNQSQMLHEVFQFVPSGFWSVRILFHFIVSIATTNDDIHIAIMSWLTTGKEKSFILLLVSRYSVVDVVSCRTTRWSMRLKSVGACHFSVNKSEWFGWVVLESVDTHHPL